MSLTFDSFLSNNEFQKQINKCISSLLPRRFYRREAKLSSYLEENLATGEKYETINLADRESDIHNAAVNECWILINEQKEKISVTLEEAIDEYASGSYNDAADIAKKVANKALDLLSNKINDEERNKDYAQLRQSISRGKTKNGQPIFSTKTENRIEYYFSPHDDVKTIIIPKYKLREPLKDLSAVDKKIKNQEGEWVGKVVEREASRFWRAFVDEHNGGEPGYVPLYAMYCWIAQSIALNEPVIKSLSESVTDEDNDGCELMDVLPGDNAAVDDEANAQEMFTFAQNYAETFSENEAIIIAGCFDTSDSAPTLQEIAKRLGLSGPSSVNRARNKLTSRVGEYLTQFPDRQNQLLFLQYLWEACQKRSSAFSQMQ